VKTGLAEQKTKIKLDSEVRLAVLSGGSHGSPAYFIRSKDPRQMGVAGERESRPAAGLVRAARSDGSDRPRPSGSWQRRHGSSMPVLCAERSIAGQFHNSVPAKICDPCTDGCFSAHAVTHTDLSPYLEVDDDGCCPVWRSKAGLTTYAWCFVGFNFQYTKMGSTYNSKRMEQCNTL
jgi:hypothetical protein